MKRPLNEIYERPLKAPGHQKWWTGEKAIPKIFKSLQLINEKLEKISEKLVAKEIPMEVEDPRDQINKIETGNPKKDKALWGPAAFLA
ncbi:MAG TPA: hypothetical protein VJL87_04705, partial [Bdellovibrionota bacterium]|nr:hypothetical protein [Bdellovibrionota bacterium]